MKHIDGTYSSLNLDSKSSKQLYKWAKKNIDGELTPQSQYHVTLIYSRTGIPSAKGETIDLPLKAEAVGWEIFPTQDGGKCLVLRIENPELDELHNLYREKYGATYDYDEYKPHVTISYDYKENSVPDTLPDVVLWFDKHTFKPLDTNWKDK